MTTPTKGLKGMAISVIVDNADDLERITRWVKQFEHISAVESWDGHGSDSGEVCFLAGDTLQYQRVVDYVASWEGE